MESLREVTELDVDETRVDDVLAKCGRFVIGGSCSPKRAVDMRLASPTIPPPEELLRPRVASAVDSLVLSAPGGVPPPSMRMRLSLALLDAVPLTVTGAMLLRTGLALNSLLSCSSSSARFKRSSRCSLSLREIASPGSSKVGRVGGLVDFAGGGGGGNETLTGRLFSVGASTLVAFVEITRLAADAVDDAVLVDSSLVVTVVAVVVDCFLAGLS